MRAFTSTEQQVATRAWERQLPLGPGATVIVQVFTSDDEQRVSVATNRQGRLLLHWGVEGGRGYKGGWRLPDTRCRPEGTVMYKNRALQTPFHQQNGNGVQVGAAAAHQAGKDRAGTSPVLALQTCVDAGVPAAPVATPPFCERPSAARMLQAVEVRLTGDETSDYLNFVVKDETTGEWYDLNGTNFQVRGPPVAGPWAHHRLTAGMALVVAWHCPISAGAGNVQA